jgi:SAM-dependent methyltransferase
MITFQLEPGSFRDRTSRVFYSENSVFRALNEEALKEWESLSSTKFFSRFMAEKKIVQTEQVEPAWEFDSAIAEKWTAFLKHQTIPFISYPYEWSFGMLKDVALLQTELLLAALDEGMILKDSSAFNFQWIGTNPVFIDIPSFMKLNAGEPWIGYRQFCQMFLYPLMLQAYKDIPFQPLFRGNIDGLEPEYFNRLMSLRDLLCPGVFTHVYLHAKAQMKYANSQKDIKKLLFDNGLNMEMIRNNVKSLRKLILNLKWKQSRSQWSHYVKEHSYTDSDHEMKKSFVRDIVTSRKWNLVWDVGCNTGTFSRIAGENAQYVVAMDSDHLAIEYLYLELKREGNFNVLPLVCNIADPSPNLGWGGLERKSLPERGKPDLTLCLALIHHLVIGANIPVKEFIDWLVSLGTSVIIEFITKEDPMVKRLLCNKQDNYTDYDIGYFENYLSNNFDVDRRKVLSSGTRILYFAQNKKGGMV